MASNNNKGDEKKLEDFSSVAGRIFVRISVLIFIQFSTVLQSRGRIFSFFLVRHRLELNVNVQFKYSVPSLYRMSR